MTAYVPASLDIPGLTFGSMEDLGADHAKILIHGPQGSGKSTLASTIARCGPTLFVDLVGEKGLQSFAGASYVHNITPVRPTSVQQFDDIYWKLAEGNHPFKAVVVDSLTSVQKMAMRFILGHSETAVKEIRKGTAPADQRSWGQTLDIMTDFATFWYGLADADRDHPMHVVMTAQTIMVDNEDTGMRDRIPDVQKGARSIVLAAPAYILYTEVIENADALGDEGEPDDTGRYISPGSHVVRFGDHPGYRTKGKIPPHLWGRIPPFLGRKSPTDLTQLSRVLGVGGVPALPAPKKAATPVAAVTTEKENAAHGS